MKTQRTNIHRTAESCMVWLEWLKLGGGEWHVLEDEAEEVYRGQSWRDL